MPLEEYPQAPVRYEKSGTWQVTSEYSRKMESFRVASREEGFRTLKLNQELAKVPAYLRAIMGDMGGSTARPWRSKFVDNRMAKARQDHLALMTDLRPIIQVSTSIETAKKTADALTKLIAADWKRQNIDLKVVTVADISDTYGTGFWRVGGAPPGINSIIPCGPDQVMPIQPSWDVQESTAIVYKTWKSVQWIKNKFPISSVGIERDIVNMPFYGENSNDTFNRPNHIDQFTWNGMSQGMRRLQGVRGSQLQDTVVGQYYRTVEVEEIFVDDLSINLSPRSVIVSDPFLSLDAHNWWYEVKPGGRLFPRKRHMVFAGSRLLSDGPSPYWHGLYPFATLRFNPIFTSFWGLSRYRNLLPINIAINEIVAGCLDLVKRALNPTSLSKDKAMSDTAWKEFFPDMPGMKVKINPNIGNIKDAMTYMDTPVIPQYVIQMLTGYLAPEFDKMSGAVDINEITGKKQVASADSIDMMRDTQNTGQRLEERQMEAFLQAAGTQVVSNILQFSTTEHRMKVLGEEGLTKEDFNREMGNMLPEDVAAQPDYWKQFALQVNAGSGHSGAKDRDKQLVMQLAGRHLYPIKGMLRKLELGDDEELFNELIAESQQAAGAPGQGAGQQGKQPTALG